VRKKFLAKKEKKREQNFSIFKHAVFSSKSSTFSSSHFIINYSEKEEKEGEKGGDCAFALSTFA